MAVRSSSRNGASSGAKSGSRMPLNSEIRDRAGAITAVIHVFAEVSTGDRWHFIPAVPRPWHSSKPPTGEHDPLQAEPTREDTLPQD
jgi:hypothetical protein